MASSSSNVVGVHYRVGKKIGEGSFGVIFEGTNLLNNQQVAIKFVRVFPDVIENISKAFCELGGLGWIDEFCEYVLTLFPLPGASKKRCTPITR
jgi:sulfatase maturation enzyme AslB (radical SAM superfamily)